MLVPPVCAGCGRSCAAPLCAGCRIPRLARLDPPPAPLDGWSAAVAYAGAAEAWLRRFKYPRTGLRGLDPAAEAVVCAWILDAARALGAPPDAIVPVPLHAAARRRHGFEPPGVLAAALARHLGRPLRRELLRRRHDTPSQTGLGREARRRNVRGAFAAERPAPGRVWIVDDVVTTGATLRACARALRRAGAVEVHAACAAFRPLGSD